MLRTELAFYIGCLNLRGRLIAQGHAHTLTVFVDFADAHMVSSQFSPSRGDDLEMSSLRSFYSPIGRGRIDLGHPTVLLPSLL
jgi:hypothetical protein